MFQSFESALPPADNAARLARLRSLLKRLRLDGLIVPHSDEYQSEYLPASARRLAWLTGFSGSAGTAIVLAKEAAVFVDGRYTLQAAQQIDTKAFAIESVIDNPPVRWVAGKVKPGQSIGYDPWLLTVAEARAYAKALDAAGAKLVPVGENPIDAIWDDRPAPPLGGVSVHPVEFAGEEAAAKLDRLRALIAERKADAAILTLADSIAWTFNIRGANVEHNPVALAFAILRRDGRPSVYIDGRKLTNASRAWLADIADIAEPSRLDADLAALAAEGTRVLLDPASAAAELERKLREAGAMIVEGGDPVALPKARKNATELQGMRNAHWRDGVAMVRFLAWFDKEAPGGKLDEIAAARTLEEFRVAAGEQLGEKLHDLSFDSISSAGPNSAVVHYRVSRQTNRRIAKDEIFLIDSGGQYRDGTTDITRTIIVGKPTAEMRDRFTRVLKGHIAVAALRFPKGTNGAQVDGFARRALWDSGLDFDHSTGHGVGAFLCVHEGPQRLSKSGTVNLETGMIVSNEPGYYKAGAWGIRIENLLAVVPAKAPKGAEREMMQFETLTLAPIDRRLVAKGLLTADEMLWLDRYHARVREELSPALAPADRRWLDRATRPLARE